MVVWQPEGRSPRPNEFVLPRLIEILEVDRRRRCALTCPRLLHAEAVSGHPRYLCRVGIKTSLIKKRGLPEEVEGKSRLLDLC